MTSRERALSRGNRTVFRWIFPVTVLPASRRLSTAGCARRWACPQRKSGCMTRSSQLAIVDEEVRARFFVDTQELGRGFALE